MGMGKRERSEAVTKHTTRELALANVVQEMLEGLTADWQSHPAEEIEAMADDFARLAVCRMAHVIAPRYVYAMLKAAGGPDAPDAVIAKLKAAEEALKSDDEGYGIDTRH
jgi:hypothetical protein